MPRIRPPSTLPDHVMTPAEFMEKVESMEDGPYKDKLKTLLKEFLEHGHTERAKLEQAITDQATAMKHLLAFMFKTIPQSHLNMNLKDYIAMTDGESKVATRPSFLKEIDEICYLQETDNGPDIEQVSKTDVSADQKCGTSPAKKMRKKKEKAKAASSTRIINSSVMKTTASAPRRLSRLQRNIPSSSATVTPARTATASSAAIKYTGGFTPKFDPRLPITPAHGLRKLDMGEKIVLMSQSGSPLTQEITKDDRGPVVIYPLKNGKTIAITADTQLSNLQLDGDTQAKLKMIQERLAFIINVPL